MAAGQPAIMLADGTKDARVQVSWPTRAGEVQALKGDRQYQSSAQKSPLGANIDAYVGLGGTRVNKGLADPRGAVVVVGLYKQTPSKPFFENIADNAVVTITLSRIFMNQPAVPRPETAMMQLRYVLEDLRDCGLSGNERNLFITTDPADPVVKKATTGSVRAGFLDGQGADHGKVEAKNEADGSISMKVTFPYALLRHIQDPYQRTNPGGFFEPSHFQFEIELLPNGAADKVPPAAPVPPPPEPPQSPETPVALPPKPDSPKPG